jgi:hypothetical protein
VLPFWRWGLIGDLHHSGTVGAQYGHPTWL